MIKLPLRIPLIVFGLGTAFGFHFLPSLVKKEDERNASASQIRTLKDIEEFSKKQ